MGVHSGVNRDACSLNFKTFVLGVYSGFQRAFLGFWDLLRGLCLPGKPKKLIPFKNFCKRPGVCLIWLGTFSNLCYKTIGIIGVIYHQNILPSQWLIAKVCHGKKRKKWNYKLQTDFKHMLILKTAGCFGSNQNQLFHSFLWKKWIKLKSF